MREALQILNRHFVDDLPQAPLFLLRSALLGLLLLSPFQKVWPLASLLLPVLLLGLGLLRELPGLRLAFLLTLTALLWGLAVPGIPWFCGVIQGAAALGLLPGWIREARLPPRDLDPRPGLGRALLPFLTPPILGAVLWHLPGNLQGMDLRLLESAQVVGMICAIAIWLTAPRQQGTPILLLCGGKSLSTLLIPWWLLHLDGRPLWAWLLALLFLLEGEWESRLLGALAAKAEKPC